MIVSLNNGLCIKLDQENHTGAMVESPGLSGDVFIPRSITFESQEYIITKISKGSFPLTLDVIDSLDFPKDSEVRTIEKGAFSYCEINSLTIPTSMDDLQDGWCKNAFPLNVIKLSPQNNFFRFYSDKLLLGKSSIPLHIYDTLYFAYRSLEKVTIPSYVKYIKPYSFSKCESLETIKILINSDLRSIGKKAFSDCVFDSLFIPSKFEKFEDGWCNTLMYLTTITISPQNKNFLILDSKIILGKSDLNSSDYDVLVFACRNIEMAIIPSFVKYISPCAFQFCGELKNIEFSEDSELVSIGHDAFYGCGFEKVSFPAKIKEIKRFAIGGCSHLKEVEFHEDSEISTFESDIFNDSSIEKVNIPKNVEKLEDGWNYSISRLNQIKVSPENKMFANLGDKIIVKKLDSKSEFFDTICFACRDIENVTIPAYIKVIDFLAFEKCIYLKTVIFEENSKIECFCSNSFSYSSIESLQIPSSVQLIGSNAFSGCFNLTSFTFADDSELVMIYSGAFNGTSIREITFPKSLNEIESNAFCGCRCLQKVNFSKISEIQRIHSYAFAHSSIDNIVIPGSVDMLDDEVFGDCNKLKVVEFLSQTLFIGRNCFIYCNNLIAISFPNLDLLKLLENSMCGLTDEISFFVPLNSTIITYPLPDE